MPYAAQAIGSIMNAQTTLFSKLNYSVNETIALVGICRTKLYEEIGAGRLKIIKCGRRTLVPAASIQQWMNALSGASN